MKLTNPRGVNVKRELSTRGLKCCVTKKEVTRFQESQLMHLISVPRKVLLKRNQNISIPFAIDGNHH